MKIELHKIQPTQLFLNKAKLEAIKNQVALEGIQSLDPIPIYKLDDNIIFTDGYTRAYFLHTLNLPYEFEWEATDFDWDEYRFHRDNCKNQGIISVADLKNRIISSEEYQIRWLDFCKKVRYELLSGKRHTL